MGHHHHHTRRDFFSRSFGAILAGGSLFEEAFLRAGWARAQSQTADAALFDIEKVADGIYAALAKPAAMANSNAAIFVLSRDVLVVDAHSKPSAAASLLAQIRREVTPKPVRYLVNSHFHWDHTQGDAAYKTANPKIDIIASDTTKRLMIEVQRDRLKETLESVPGMIDTLNARLARAADARERDWCNDQIRQLRAYQEEMESYPLELPTLTFAESYTIRDRTGDLHLEFHGKAHTAGDIQVFAPSRKVVAAGDTIIGFLPNMNDGYPRRWPGTIDSVAQLPFDHIVCGHRDVQQGRDRMGQFRNFIEDLTARVEQGKRAGRTLVELQKTITPVSVPALQDHDFGGYLAANMDKHAVYLGRRTQLEDRLAGNVAAVWNNLDKA